MNATTPDIMALEEVRIANEAGRAVLVFDRDLDHILFANTAAAALFGWSDAAEDRNLPALVTRQIAGVRPILEEDGEAMLRVKGGAEGLQVWVTAHLMNIVAADGTTLALMAAPLPGAARESEAALAGRLLAESGCADRVAIVSAEGILARTDDLADDDGQLAALPGSIFPAEDAAFGGGANIWPVASTLALVRVPERAMNEPAASRAGPVDADAAASPIGALLDRWRSRGGEQASVPAGEPASGEAATGTSAPESEPEAPEPDATKALEHPVALDEPDRSRTAPETEEVREAPASPLAEPARFVWRIDADGRFSHLSHEFAAVVGPAAADVIGVAFTEVAEAFGFDEDGEIAGLMQRRDTFSGRGIFWPVEGTEHKVLVELAALPVYGRDRVFEGFRGFGVVRPEETVNDLEAIGMMLVAEEPEAEDAGEAVPRGGLADDSEEMPAFGRRTPAQESAAIEDEGGGDAAGTVVRLEERRRREPLLSPAEADAFRAIGAELSPTDQTARPLQTGEEPASEPEKREAPVDPERASLDPELSALFSGLPLPVLVEMRTRPVFANAGFWKLTGYRDLAAFREAGGLDALFAEAEEPQDSDGTGERRQVPIRRADGSVTLARVQIQRVSLSGRSCLTFYFTPEGDLEPAAPEDDAATHQPTAREAAEALRSEVEELRAVLDTATDGIVLLDTPGAVRSMNGAAEALFGLSAEDYRGRDFTELLAADSRRPTQNYLETLREEGLAGILNDGREVDAQVAGGGTIPLFITIGRLPGERGWCVVLRDIAHWKRAEEELVAARRQAEDASLHKSRFLANISHELRTPLNAIIGFADVMTSETYGPIGHERYMEYLGDIKRSGHHVLDLVNDLLDISKIEAGKVELAFEAVALNDVVSEVVSLMQPQANRERVIVRSNLPGGIPPVVADRRTLRQIALNLVSNAIRFTPAGGQIIASTSYGENGEVALRFRDSGIGMTDREIEIALTPFQQVNAAGKERGDGTGLGLPLTKAMVEANRALFRIASTPGEGTLIEITFPAQRVLAH
ncbi:PAS domain-containing sensor histidine kinase [Aureimonas mangrovi]|uniref:PAS domain-containing sensor histidine kinase n=1 Tax=Aureimonas mangrovi TaxID=2758041 RepID=UPI00163D4316|nr:PAS domain-containing sensor histidine kinase [Aureimonas mangrovi]